MFFLSNGKAFVPSEAYSFDFNIKMHDMSFEREEKIYESVELLRLVFSSPDFRDRILNHKFNGKKAFAWNNGLSNKQIYEKILNGSEKLDPRANNAMDVEIDLFTDMNSIVLGYTKTQTKKIWMNTKYFNNKTTAVYLGSHLMHEWLHKLGFGHQKKRSEDRQYTVPYAIGNIVNELGNKTIEEFSIPKDLRGDNVFHWQSNRPEYQNRLLLR